MTAIGLHGGTSGGIGLGTEAASGSAASAAEVADGSDFIGKRQAEAFERVEKVQGSGDSAEQAR